jgi:LuxR family maltose regulon positive regulatory protein
VAWVSLTTDDNDPRTFCSAILASLDDCNAPGWRAPDRAGRSPDELDLLAEVVDALDALSGTLVLVLDDVHLLTAPAPLRAIERLIRHRPGCLRLVLSARCDPPVHIARLRAEGQLAEIRAEHLRFRPDEAAELLSGAGLDVDAGQVTVMLARTEGWAAALRLIAVGLRDRRDADEVRRFLDELHVTDRSLTDYLASEVLDGLAADVRDVLLRVSICDRLSPSLAVTLTGRADASDVLRRVERATSLVAWFGGRDKEYRIHPLLRAYLEADLEREHPDTARALRVVAACWYEARGALATAAAHARRKR